MAENEKKRLNELQSYSSTWRGHEGFAWWLCDTLKPRTIVDVSTEQEYSAIVFALSQLNPFASSTTVCAVVGGSGAGGSGGSEKEDKADKDKKEVKKKRPGDVLKARTRRLHERLGPKIVIVESEKGDAVAQGWPDSVFAPKKGAGPRGIICRSSGSLPTPPPPPPESTIIEKDKLEINILHMGGAYSSPDIDWAAAHQAQWESWAPHLAHDAILLVYGITLSSNPTIKRFFDQLPMWKTHFSICGGLGVLSHDRSTIATVCNHYGLSLVAPPTPLPSAVKTKKCVISRALYGGCGPSSADVTPQLRALGLPLVLGPRSPIALQPHTLFGMDPLPGSSKTLTVWYGPVGELPRIFVVDEHCALWVNELTFPASVGVGPHDKLLSALTLSSSPVKYDAANISTCGVVAVGGVSGFVPSNSKEKEETKQQEIKKWDDPQNSLFQAIQGCTRSFHKWTHYFEAYD